MQTSQREEKAPRPLKKGVGSLVHSNLSSFPPFLSANSSLAHVRHNRVNHSPSYESSEPPELRYVGPPVATGRR